MLFLARNRYLHWVNRHCLFACMIPKWWCHLPQQPEFKMSINSRTFPLQIQIILTKQRSPLAMRQKVYDTVEEYSSLHANITRLRCVKRLCYLVRRWLTWTGTGYQQPIITLPTSGQAHVKRVMSHQLNALFTTYVHHKVYSNFQHANLYLFVCMMHFEYRSHRIPWLLQLSTYD